MRLARERHPGDFFVLIDWIKNDQIVAVTVRREKAVANARIEPSSVFGVFFQRSKSRQELFLLKLLPRLVLDALAAPVKSEQRFQIEMRPDILERVAIEFFHPKEGSDRRLDDWSRRTGNL